MKRKETHIVNVLFTQGQVHSMVRDYLGKHELMEGENYKFKFKNQIATASGLSCNWTCEVEFDLT